MNDKEKLIAKYEQLLENQKWLFRELNRTDHQMKKIEPELPDDYPFLGNPRGKDTLPE